MGGGGWGAERGGGGLVGVASRVQVVFLWAAERGGGPLSRCLPELLQPLPQADVRSPVLPRTADGHI